MPNPHRIHRGQSRIWANVRNLWHQSEEISHRKWNFSEEGFKSDVSDNNQTMSYCGVRAHFQNIIDEAAIKQLTEKARTMLIHAKHLWTDVIQPAFGPLRRSRRNSTWITSVLGNPENHAPKVLVLCTTKSTSGIIIRSFDRCTYSMHNFKVPVLFRNGTSEWEWAHKLEYTQFTRETFPSY